MKNSTHDHTVIFILVIAALLLTACGGAATPAVPGANLAGKVWKWQKTEDNYGKTVPMVPNPANYTLEFILDGNKVNLHADCNSGGGSFVITNNVDLTIKVETMTTAACPPDSLSDEYVNQLNSVVSYKVENNGELVLAMDNGSGMRFAP